jgi:hypothetical protein
MHPNAVIQEVFDDLLYRADMKHYNEERLKLEEEFKQDLFEEFGVTDNPKREKAYAYAWEHGHANGFSEVYNVFDGIVELIK